MRIGDGDRDRGASRLLPSPGELATILISAPGGDLGDEGDDVREVIDRTHAIIGIAVHDLQVRAAIRCRRAARGNVDELAGGAALMSTAASASEFCFPFASIFF